MKAFLICAALLALANAHSPVLMWPAEKFALPTGESVLQMLDLEDFEKLFDNKKVIVFHKKSFSIEEVSYPKQPLSYLQNIDALALQGVKSMHKFLTSMASSSSNMKLVKLDNENLADQQDLIEKTMKENPEYSAILVGSGSHRLSRRAAENTAGCTMRGDCLVHVGIVLDDKAKNGTCTIACQEGNITISINNKADLRFTSDKHGYSIAVDSPFVLDSEVTWVPKEFSFSCNQLVIRQPKENLKYTLMQVQVMPSNATVFPDSFDCSTWFTTTLWMGLSVVLFYLFILFVAILFLLSVKTNDRLDDPKGKTITVNVTD